MSARRGWWRENRWWLPALPVALVAMVASSGYLVDDYWWSRGLHHESASAEQGHVLAVTQDYTDKLGATTRSYQVRLTGVEQTDEVTTDLYDGPQPPGKGQQALVAHLDWKADPDQVLRGCQVALVDSDGRRYEIVGDAPADSCTPSGRGGPGLPALEGEVRGTIPADETARPSSWSTDPVFLLPDGVTITQVLVWWKPPEYVRLNVS